jgi:ribonuclease HI
MTLVRCVLGSQASNFVGSSRRHTNNVGELCALPFALHWIHDRVALGSFVFEFDSMHFSDAIRCRSRTRTNLSMVLRARSVLDSSMSQGARIS